MVKINAIEYLYRRFLLGGNYLQMMCPVNKINTNVWLIFCVFYRIYIYSLHLYCFDKSIPVRFVCNVSFRSYVDS